jgi:hypothetical protein
LSPGLPRSPPAPAIQFALFRSGKLTSVSGMKPESVPVFPTSTALYLEDRSPFLHCHPLFHQA